MKTQEPIADPCELPPRAEPLLSMPRKSALRNLATFLLGCLVVLSLPLLPQLEKTPRILDVIGSAGIIYLGLVVFKFRLPVSVWIAGIVVVISILLPLVSALMLGDVARVIVCARLLLSISGGILIAQIAVYYSQIDVLIFGIWTGAFVAMLIAFGQSLDVEVLVGMLPADRNESAVFGVLRPSAIWGHPNAAAQVTMAAAAMIFIAKERGRHFVLLPLLMFLLIASPSYDVMLNRAPLIVSAMAGLFFSFMYGSMFLKGAAIVATAIFLSILAFSPQSILTDRWSGTFSGLSTNEQAYERLGAALTGLDLSFEAPFGHSDADRSEKLMAQAGVRAAHNGFVFAALTIGPWVTLILFGILFSVCFGLRPPAVNRHYGMTMGSISIMLLFEDSIFEPSIMTLLVLTAALIFSERSKNQHTNAVKDLCKDTNADYSRKDLY